MKASVSVSGSEDVWVVKKLPTEYSCIFLHRSLDIDVQCPTVSECFHVLRIATTMDI